MIYLGKFKGQFDKSSGMWVAVHQDTPAVKLFACTKETLISLIKDTL